MTWSARHQLIIFGALVIIGIIVLASILIPRINIAPSCTDHKQNGAETGIDCGGTCSNYCTAEISPLVVSWVRSFPVTDRIYNVVAYVVNKNDNASIKNINYEFRLYDKDHTFITRREGSTFVGETGPFAVFEESIDVGNAVPAETTFHFTDTNPTWLKTNPVSAKLRVPITDIVLTDETTHPLLSAKAGNPDPLFTIPELDVIAILYGKDDNAVNVSKTHIAPDMLPGDVRDIHFTWPKPLGAEIVRKEVIPLINVFGVTK